jgi:CO/xanthine dehydrogenase FAD-binding subunit
VDRQGGARVKPPPFDYAAPNTVDEALALLAEHGYDGKVLAGGQSLVPLLNFRLARPEMLIDVNDVEELSYLRRQDGKLHIGAMTRHAQAEHSPLVRESWPLVAEALRWVGHPQIRNRGTIGGSAAHADPAAELPIVFAALDARFLVRSVRGERTLRHEEMFRAQLESGLEHDELLCEIELPAMPDGAGVAWEEYARRHGDFALGGAAAVVVTNGDGRCASASVALLGAGATPLRPAAAEQALVGREVTAAVAAEAAAEAVRGISPTGDIHGSSEYRRELIQTLTARAITRAAARAKEATA